MATRHLDLGCGGVPRNPYALDQVHGVDIAPSPGSPHIAAANLALQPIPFPSDHFDAVSAYDFLEHVPRLLPTADHAATRFPYIELMNEVWRVLKAGGRFYASTPAYPHRAAFLDPTHVNVLAAGAHAYFTSPQRMAAMYGYVGNFKLLSEHMGSPDAQSLRLAPPDSAGARLLYRYRRWRGHFSHLIWEFQAIK